MAGTQHAEQISRAESVGSAALWFGVLGAPLAWVLHMVIGYSLEEWFACSSSALEQGVIGGLGVRSVAVLITVVFGLVAAASGIVALRCLRRIAVDGESSNRARWMAIVGIMNSGLYLLIIVGGFGPALLLEVCEASP